MSQEMDMEQMNSVMDQQQRCLRELLLESGYEVPQNAPMTVLMDIAKSENLIGEFHRRFEEEFAQWQDQAACNFEVPEFEIGPASAPPLSLADHADEDFSSLNDILDASRHESANILQLMRQEFVEPNISKMKQYVRAHHPRTKRGNPLPLFWTPTGALGPDTCCETKSAFTEFGPGVTLYFKWIKFMCYLSLIFGIISLPMIYFNMDAYEGNLNSFVSFFESSMLSSVANMYTKTVVINNTLTSICDSECKDNKQRLGMIYTYSELAIAAVFILAFLYQHHFLKQEHKKVHRNVISIDDYSVQISNIPKDTDVLALEQYFQRLTGESVVVVEIAHNDSKLIELFIKRGRLLNRIWQCASNMYWARERYVNAKNDYIKKNQSKGKEINTQKMNLALFTKEIAAKKAVDKYRKMHSKLEEINKLRKKTCAGNDAVCAFVTFSSPLGVARCLKLFPKWGSSSRHTFHGQKVSVHQAPAPSTIIWQNLEFSKLSQGLRQTATTLFAFIVIMASASLSCLIFWVRGTFKSDIELASCPDLNATSLMGYAVTSSSEDDCFCALISWSEIYIALANAAHPCNEFWTQRMTLIVYMVLSTFFVAVVNYTLCFVIRKFSAFEKHHTIVAQEKSIAQRLFFVLFINTGLVVLAINTLVTGNFLNSLNIAGRWDNTPGYPDFTNSWYSDVGLQLTLLFIFNIFVPHMEIMIVWLYTHLIVRNRWRTPTSQRELNSWHLGPEFRLNYRYAQNLMTLCVAMLYGAGIPVLYFLASAAFFVYYWVDKYMLLRFYRTPARFDTTLGDAMSHILKYALVPNLAFAIWMFSYQGVFWVGDATNLVQISLENGVVEQSTMDRISTSTIWPLLVTLGVYTAILIAVFLYRFFIGLSKTLCSCIEYRQPTVCDHPPLQTVQENDRLAGLKTYAMMDNSAYQKLFGIDDRYAATCKRIVDIENIPANHIPPIPNIYT